MNTRSMIGFYEALEVIIYRWCMKQITTWSTYGVKRGGILGKGIRKYGYYVFNRHSLPKSIFKCMY